MFAIPSLRTLAAPRRTTAPPVDPATIAYLQNAANGSDRTAYTFSSQNLGTAASDRYIVVCAHARAASGARSLSSLTVGGVSASIVVQVNNTTSNSSASAIAIAAVPTGTTGDVVVTWNAGMLRCGIQMYRLTNVNPTAFDFGSSIADDPTFNLDIPAGGVAVGAGQSGSGSGTIEGWSGLTQDHAGTVEVVRYTSASDEFASAETGRTITLDFGGTIIDPIGLFASWQPAA